MDKKTNIILLDKFFQGLTTDEENQVLRDWIKLPGSKDEFYQYFRQCWHLADDEMNKELQDEMLVDILGKINGEPQMKPKLSGNHKTDSFTIRKIIRYAAVACVAFLIGGTVAFYLAGNYAVEPMDEFVAMSVQNGQKADIVLADGTRVYINSASTVRYNNTYNKKDRTLTLEGEAYFEVAKNEEIPFIVQANGIEIEALGTSFNVRAYPGDNTVGVTLIEGKVKVNDTSTERYMQPNERLEYNLAEGRFNQTELLHPNANQLLWRSKELVCYGESLEDICAALTRMYNCEFIFESESIKKHTYNGIIKNNSLENVLEYICQAASIRYEIKTDNTIVLY